MQNLDVDIKVIVRNGKIMEIFARMIFGYLSRYDRTLVFLYI